MRIRLLTFVFLLTFLCCKASVSINATIKCAGDTSSFSVQNASGIDSAVWKFGDSTNKVTIYKPPFTASHKYDTSGNYTVAVTYYFGGLPFVFDTIFFIPGIPKVNLLNVGPGQCQYTYTLDATNPGSSYLWSTGARSATITQNYKGTFWVRVKNQCGTVSDTAHIDFTLVPPPIGTYYLSSQINLCEGDDTVFLGPSYNTYSLLDGTKLTNEFVVPQSDSSYYINISNTCGTGFETFNTIFHPKPILRLTSDTDICNGKPFLIDPHIPDPLHMVINWNYQSSIDTSVTVKNSGTYSVTVTSIYHCGSDTATINVLFLKPPAVNLGPDTFICKGNTIGWDVTNPSASYLWEDSSTSPLHTVDKTTKVFVRVSNGCGTVSDTVNVKLIQLFLHLPDDTLLCSGNSFPVNIFIDSTTNYLWSNGSTSSGIIISQPDVYIVTVENQCGKLSGSFDVQVHGCNGCTNMPNAFTPDNDGKNDLFRVISDCQFFEFHLRIYNRWGEMVYESYDSKAGWDGKYNGKDEPIGSYNYILDYSSLDINAQSTGTKIGYVVLIR